MRRHVRRLLTYAETDTADDAVVGELDLIEVPFQKGYVLILTDDDFARALSRGKAKKRRQAFQKRLERMQQERIAGEAGYA